MPEALSPERIEFYGEHGYLILENRIPDDTISRIRDEIARFEEEARGMTLSNDRLDLEDSHTPDNPPIRRIKLPHRISDVARGLMFLDHVPAPVRALIGPDLRRHTTRAMCHTALHWFDPGKPGWFRCNSRHILYVFRLRGPSLVCRFPGGDSLRWTA